MRSPDSAADAAPSFSLRVANTVAALEVARATLDRFCKDQQLPERIQFKLELVLEEMLMNRVLHAFAPGTLGHTEVTLRLEANRVVLCFDDEGVAFDPLQAPPPTPAASLQDVGEGGLGLLLTRKAARECRYQRIDGRNRLTVVLDR